MWRLTSLCALTLVAFGYIGCASTTPTQVVSRIPVSEQSYVIDPLTGYPLTLDSEVKQRLRTAFTGFAEGRPLAEVASIADDMVASDPTLLPAQVLRAQVDFLLAGDRGALDRLRPVLDEHPDYLAAALLGARAHERLGDMLEAFIAFDHLSSWNVVADRRAIELRPRALEIVERRFDDALERGRAEDAQQHLDRLASWGVDEDRILDFQQRLYFATGDTGRELEALRKRSLLPKRPRDDLEPLSSDQLDLEARRRLRQADLEVEVGDVRAGMEILEELVNEAPDEPDLADRLDSARFLWRLELLPPQVQEISRRPELNRAELASLLYWLFPRVRFSTADNPPIAADILDLPNRNEVLRVLDMDLMSVDESVHRFHPEKEATRESVLSALLSLIQDAERPSPCLEGQLRLNLNRRSRRWVCEQAAGCGLIAESGECLPAATLSGREAVDLVRLCLKHLGAS